MFRKINKNMSLRRVVNQTKDKNRIVESLHNKNNYKEKKIFIDALQIDIDNKIYLIFAKNMSQIAINISEKFLISKRRLYTQFISSICKKRLL